MKAFPILDYQNGENSFIYEHKGMDLRDYFAAKAMAAIIIYDESDFHFDSLAKESYRVADAMMEARNV